LERKAPLEARAPLNERATSPVIEEAAPDKMYTRPLLPDGGFGGLLFLVLATGALWIIWPLLRLLHDGERVARSAVSAARPTPESNARDFPSQDSWVKRAGAVRDPIRGFVFGIQARANARAMTADRDRMKAARAAAKEYVGLYEDLRAGEEAALAYAVRRDLADEFYTHACEAHRDAFAEAHHRRLIADKRRQKEAIEGDTRRIEAQHEQEALIRFKEPKFAAGLARFEEKQKGYEVGSASADAAIAESKAPPPSTTSDNENAEVAALHRQLQLVQAAIEEGERLGRDTQGLRKKRDLYKDLLNIA
jgi:hypothetical protein